MQHSTYKNPLDQSHSPDLCRRLSARSSTVVCRWLIAILFIFSGLTAYSRDVAFRAYDATPIFGDFREVVRSGKGYVYLFPYRDGMVTYNPRFGASWSRDASAGTVVASTPKSGSANSAARLPNSCLIFACAKAEEIRLGLDRSRTRSQVISFRRTDGTGHAFVVYQRNGRLYGEDNRGIVAELNPVASRSEDDALRIAAQFSVQTHPPGFPSPCQAAFVGRY